ncbi:hypothetical protein F5B19DRAFT_217625 [Rostrohypoxylon terebratum]|nr:hypothetical protein F5B19DRAFT_217625 [Rostrohypoxylon terebratum]
MSSISRLPESTTRLLGSSLVITTPITLVKELLDNSIDAKASSIEVIISADTVKKIEVRDNGIGIHPDDYDALGRRGHTSKLRSFEELKTQPVRTLGFRGEALASANSLAQITVTTKIASEPVAAILHVMPGKGGVSKQQATSAPVGTTVSVTDLFGKLPVRKQWAIKESAKTIDKIREVLRSYAMARPQLKLSFKVLQSPRQSWSYSPKSGASVKEAAIQLFGSEITTHCLEKRFQMNKPQKGSDKSNEQQSLSHNSSYIFEAFVLKPNCIPSKAPKQHYFSIDGRPITGKRGTMKKILKIYSEQMTATPQQNSSGVIPKGSFIRLNIECPPGSYDINIEPSKDDILFSEENVLLDGFKGLCKEVYETYTLSNVLEKNLALDNISETNGSSSRKPQTQSNSQAADKGSSLLKRGDGLTSQPILAAQSQQQKSIAGHQLSSSQSQEEQQHISSLRRVGFTPINARVSNGHNSPMSTRPQSFKDISLNTEYAQCKADISTDFNRYSQDCSRKKRQQHFQAQQGEADAIESSALQDVNPWVIAKMNAPTMSKERALKNPMHDNNSPLPVFELPMTPDSPILRHIAAAPRDLDVSPSQQYLNSPDSPRELRSRVLGGPYRSPISSPPERSSQQTAYSTKMPVPLKPRRHHVHMPWSPPSSIESTVPSHNITHSSHKARVLDGMKQTQISFQNSGGKSKKRRLEKYSDKIDRVDLEGQERSNEDGLQKMLAAARQSLTHQLSQGKANYDSRQTRSHPKASIPGGSYTQLSTDLLQEGGCSKTKEPIRTTLPNDDPRAYLLRRQKSMAEQERSAIPKKCRRMKSSLLPLENVPSENQMHATMLIELLNLHTLRIFVQGAMAYDKYVEKGFVKNGLEMDLDTGYQIEERLKTLLQNHCTIPDSDEAELEIGLCSLLKGKSTITAT